MPKNQLTSKTLTTDRFLKRRGGMMGSLANFFSTIAKRPTKSTESTNSTITAADFQGNVCPPKLRASKNKVEKAKTMAVPV